MVVVFTVIHMYCSSSCQLLPKSHTYVRNGNNSLSGKGVQISYNPLPRVIMSDSLGTH